MKNWCKNGMEQKTKNDIRKKVGQTIEISRKMHRNREPKSDKEIDELFATSNYYFHKCFSTNGKSRFYSKMAIAGISLDNVLAALESVYDKTSPQYLRRRKRINKTIGFCFDVFGRSVPLGIRQ